MSLYLIVLDISLIHEFLKLFFLLVYLESAALCEKEVCTLTVQYVKIFLQLLVSWGVI